MSYLFGNAMDALTHFLTELALWNILLATLAFLFGILMGHWMWGQFKKKLSHTHQSLHQSEAQVQDLVEQVTELKETKAATSSENDKKAKELAIELTASRTAFQQLKSRTKETEDSLKKSLVEREKSVKEKETKITSLQQELTKSQRLEKESAAQAKAATATAKSASEDKAKSKNKEKELPVQSAPSSSQKKEWLVEREKLAAALKQEKEIAESLRRKITSFQGREKDLEAKLETLRRELKKGER